MRHLVRVNAVMMTIATSAVFVQSPPSATSPPRLMIAVIQGEDAVNIISQKTAVAPIVEVRDHNKLPVAGAVVVFWISSGNATFGGGAGQLTVVTDAAGRATASELVPVSRGSVQIDIVATAEGNTAMRTLSQTNVATLADAGGGRVQQQTLPPAGSGKLSKTAWAGILGGSAAAAVLVVGAAGGDAVSSQILPGCNTQQLAGGNFPETRTIEMGRRSGTFTFAFDTQRIPDRMVLSSAGRVVFDTGCIGTDGPRTESISFSGNSTTVSVAVTPNCGVPGSTAWSFTVFCPR